MDEFCVAIKYMLMNMFTIGNQGRRGTLEKENEKLVFR